MGTARQSNPHRPAQAAATLAISALNAKHVLSCVASAKSVPAGQSSSLNVFWESGQAPRHSTLNPGRRYLPREAVL